MVGVEMTTTATTIDGTAVLLADTDGAGMLAVAATTPGVAVALEPPAAWTSIPAMHHCMPVGADRPKLVDPAVAAAWYA